MAATFCGSAEMPSASSRKFLTLLVEFAFVVVECQATLLQSCKHCSQGVVICLLRGTIIYDVIYRLSWWNSSWWLFFCRERHTLAKCPLLALLKWDVQLWISCALVSLSTSMNSQSLATMRSFVWKLSRVSPVSCMAFLNLYVTVCFSLGRSSHLALFLYLHNDCFCHVMYLLHS